MSPKSLLLTRPPFPSRWSSIPISLGNLNLANTLPVGQSFLWHRCPILGESCPSQPTVEYSRAIDLPPRVVCLRQSSAHLFYTAIHTTDAAAAEDLECGTTRRWLEDYFQLEAYPDLEGMYSDWRRRDPDLFGKTELDARAIGVRVLRQDPWECLIAFITSTNNHIPRITSLMHRLSQHFSPSLLDLDHPDGPVTYHVFPPPHLLPSKLEPLLREMGFGYRAGFIESALATLRGRFGEDPGRIEAGLASWRSSDIDHVREKLIELKGVGRKVADCVMLMCLDQPSLIPVDTHVGAIASRHPCFPSRLRNKPMSKQLYDEIQSFLGDKWGPLGGWCQAVMFAADLPSATTNPKPADGFRSTPTSPSPSTSAKSTKTVKAESESPLKGNSKRLIAVGLPGAHGFKRTRSATRIELARRNWVGSKVTGSKDLDIEAIPSSTPAPP